MRIVVIADVVMSFDNVVAGGLLATDPMLQGYLDAVARVNIGVDSHGFGDARHHDVRFGLDLFPIALGVIGAIVVVLGGLIWRTQFGSTRPAHQMSADLGQAADR